MRFKIDSLYIGCVSRLYRQPRSTRYIFRSDSCRWNGFLVSVFHPKASTKLEQKVFIVTGNIENHKRHRFYAGNCSVQVLFFVFYILNGFMAHSCFALLIVRTHHLTSYTTTNTHANAHTLSHTETHTETYTCTQVSAEIHEFSLHMLIIRKVVVWIEQFS